MRFFQRNEARKQTRDLLDDLGRALDSSDPDQLLVLCRANEQEIVESFPSWRRIPTALQADPRAVDRHMQIIGNVALMFAQKLGKPDLLAQISGTGDNNPIAAARTQLATADDLHGAGRYDEEAAVMASLVAELERLRGTAVPELLALALGRLGRARFAGGSPAVAVEPLKRAAELCLGERDVKGMFTYCLGLFDVQRYLGDAAEAATSLGFVIQVAEATGEPDLPWYRRELEILRAGEPLNRLIAVLGDRRYELDEIEDAVRASGARDVRIGLEFWRNRPTIAAAERMTAEAMRLASLGRFNDALAVFEAASAIDPHDPSPHYNAGIALLEAGRYADARAAFERTGELAPGWFLCRRYAWLAQSIAVGQIDPRVAGVLIRTDDDQRPAAERRKLLDLALPLAPELGWLRLQLASVLRAEGHDAEAETELRRGLAGITDDDVRVELLVQLAVLIGLTSGEGARLAAAAVDLQGSVPSRALAVLGSHRNAPSS